MVVEDEGEQTEQRLQIAFGPFLWRSFAVLALTGEIALWAEIQRQGRGFPPGIRMAWLIRYTPRTLILAFFLAAVLTVLVDLFVRMVIGPPLRRWLSPTAPLEEDDVLGRDFGFHFDATERVINSRPGRRVLRWRSDPGTLVLTDRRVWFFPATWDGEPWSVACEKIRSAALEPPSGFFSGLIRGLPPRLRLDAGPEPEDRATFTLAEPVLVQSWFDSMPGVPARPS